MARRTDILEDWELGMWSLAGQGHVPDQRGCNPSEAPDGIDAYP
ncbi:hypothetical protein [Halohasta litchfieldiae]|nr:hypothetical protein [Halohasta litchfieldiae]